jgi:Ca-activated chloride channel family protein
VIAWGNPAALLWLWSLVPLAGLFLLLHRRREAKLRAVIDDEAAARLAARGRGGLARAQSALRLAACALVIVALARPRWGIRWQEGQGGLEVIVALDASNSMLAGDFKPDRLQRAKLGLAELLKKLAGDRIGLVAFAGSSFLQCPLTDDYAAFSMMLDDVRPGTLPRGGTAIAQALVKAAESFGGAGGAGRVVILVSDGEDHEGGVDGAIGALRQKGVRVFAVGVGTAGGGLIPAGEGDPGPFLRDGSGNVVRTSLHEGVLEKIAAATGGAYIRATAEDFGLDRLLGQAGHGAGLGRRGQNMVRTYEERFPWFLAAAALLLAVESLAAEALRRRRVVP